MDLTNLEYELLKLIEARDDLNEEAEYVAIAIEKENKAAADAWAEYIVTTCLEDIHRRKDMVKRLSDAVVETVKESMGRA